MISLEELRRVQLKALEILDVVSSICRKYSIDYSLCGGSVVGAYLYNGFLPWDDDIDIMMTRKNYNRFLSVCKKELPKKYELCNYNTSDSYYVMFSKVIDRTTTLIQDNIASGVFLDITVYDKVPNNKLKAIDFFMAGSAAKIIARLHRKDETKKTLLVKKLRRIWPIFFRIGEIVFRILGRTHQYSYCELYGACCQTKLYDASIFENYTSIRFEGSEYQIVSDFIGYLENRYERTDFHEPKEKQVPPHITCVDLSTPYKNYS